MLTWGQINDAFSGDIRYTVDYTDEFGHILTEQGEILSSLCIHSRDWYGEIYRRSGIRRQNAIQERR